MFPIVSIKGRFDGSFWRTDKDGIKLLPAKPYNKVKHGLKVKPDKLPCKIHQKADELYQGFTEETKAEWRRAIKVPFKSAYDLWMGECMTCFFRGENAPSHPSISGGHTWDKVVCDSLIPPPS